MRLTIKKGSPCISQRSAADIRCITAWGHENLKRREKADRLKDNWSIRSFTGANYQAFWHYVVLSQLCVPRALCSQVLGSYTIFMPNLTQRSISQSFSGAIHYRRTWRRLSPQTRCEGEPGSTLRSPRSTSRCVMCLCNLIPTQHSEPQDSTVLVNVLVCYLWNPFIAQTLQNPACFCLSVGLDVNAAFKGLRGSLVPGINGLIRISGRACVLWLRQ